MKSFFKKIIPKKLIILFWHKPKAMLAALLFGFPAHRLVCIAVAGTKGKTSTAYYLSHILDSANIKNVLFSTGALKIDREETLNTLKLTTPTPFFLHSFLAKACRHGCTHAIIEVSSHAIDQHRIWGIPFSLAIMTNLTPDHLEYHTDHEEYITVHKRLVTKKITAIFLNGDDKNLLPFSSFPAAKQIFTTDPFMKKIKAESPLPGAFNAMNLLMAACAGRRLNISENTILTAIKTMTSAPGRTEKISEGQNFDVIVDYAHSPESLKNFFEAFRLAYKKNIIAVFGACGDRDPQQRPWMGKILDTYADICIITTDDPYSENPNAIASHIQSGIMQKKPNETLFNIPDRKEAMRKAFSLAREGDCVCILGKGAEQWQVFGANGTKKIPWDDRKIARELLTPPAQTSGQ
ncbi:UDP-N-acetylmuramoyl-L-alanyl-D-glutamate--2,6-diaminopimelate ligase [Candidatus Uhrbacteria bacterium]|nr:UDP-N-acetylmuramoyl-L-alanyl-D-glutamate--2,6-diaminopimelate ligase [Candidatus Uhrbacteria bacterium]